MLKVMNTVAVTLLVALVVVVPGTLLGQYLPGFFNPSLQRVAVAAWLSGLISWWIARTLSRRDEQVRQQASKSSAPRAIGMTVGFLAVATGIVVAYRFFGDGLLG